MDIIDMKDYTCCITGHRDIPENRMDYVKAKMEKEILQVVEDGYTQFISGFAGGADLMLAAIVAGLKKRIAPSV